MMKFLVFFCIVAYASAFYTDVDETLDLDSILKNPKELQPYLDCFLDRKPCTSQANAFKGHFLEILLNACKECDDRLKHMAEEFILDVLVMYPEDADLLKAKYDPTGANLPNLALEVSKY